MRPKVEIDIPQEFYTQRAAGTRDVRLLTTEKGDAGAVGSNACLGERPRLQATRPSTTAR
jgi:hypothetical protein